jgi:hypothetical protein
MSVLEILEALPEEFENRCMGGGNLTVGDVHTNLTFRKEYGKCEICYTAPEDNREQGTYFRYEADTVQKAVIGLARCIIRHVISGENREQKLYTGKFNVFKDDKGNELDPIELKNRLESLLKNA